MKFLSFPKTRQATDFSCGAAVTQAMLYYYGIEKREDEIGDALGTDTDGTEPEAILAVLRKVGLRCRPGRMTVEGVRAWIKIDVPVILSIQAWADDEPKDYTDRWGDGHYVVAVGYDDNGNFILEDPSILDQRGVLPADELEKRWHDRTKDGHVMEHFGIAVWGKEPRFDPDKRIRILARQVAARYLARGSNPAGCRSPSY